MIERTHQSVLLLFIVLAWAVCLIVAGVSVSVDFLRPFSVVSGVVAVTLTGFDRWAWRLRCLHGWFVKRPDLNGTWRAELRSNWIDPGTGQRIPPIVAFVAIRQSYSSISVRMMTAESSSELLSAGVVQAIDDTCRLVGVYRNEPRISVQHRSRVHNGALLLQINGSPPETLDGHYWTDRGTQGEIRLSERNPTIVGSFQVAQRLWQERPTDQQRVGA